MQEEVVTIEPAIDPNNRITFLLDWELTMKCNLDCSYCPTGMYGGHDNTSRHPTVSDCVKTIDFLYQYVDLYMSTKKRGLRYAILNVYGGESLHHPKIVEILTIARDKHAAYKQNWNLTITTTTNAIVTDDKLSKIIPLVDEFTCSYHTEATAKQKDLFKQNLVKIKQANKQLKVVILMHARPDLFDNAQDMVRWCQENGIRHLPRQLDHGPEQEEFNYTEKQVIWLDQLYTDRSHKVKEKKVNFQEQNGLYDLAATGRACCGGRTMCVNQDHRERVFYVSNRFKDWFCSVNEFFVYVKQRTGEIFVNKDCKMNFEGSVGPIGHINEYPVLIDFVGQQLRQKSLRGIRCAKNQCMCGLCAPKAKNLDNLKNIMAKFDL